MGEKKPRVDHIERLTGRGLTKIRRLEVNVRHAKLLRLGWCDLQFRFVDVEPDGLAMRANSARELDRGVAAAAADIRTNEPSRSPRRSNSDADVGCITRESTRRRSRP